jgi:hypothetical protein
MRAMMSARVFIVGCVLLAPALLASCGGDENQGSEPPASTVSIAENASDEPGCCHPRIAADLSPRETEAARVGLAYLTALSAKNWSAACAVRTQFEQERFAGLAGTCEQYFAKISEGLGDFDPTYDIRSVRITGDVAAITYAIRYSGSRPDQLYAVRSADAWHLFDPQTPGQPVDIPD